MEKLAAHRRGELHRAFSVLVYNARGEVLLQRRADVKYHTPGLWTNACDGHPRPGETVLDAAQRRLWEEMGIRCPLAERAVFVYRAELEGGMIEHEVDHVLVGHFEGEPAPDSDEVSAWRWADARALAKDMSAHPECYAPWFRSAQAKLEAQSQGDGEDDVPQ
jgi:isopentenyl-diphosphate delta-isomerase